MISKRLWWAGASVVVLAALVALAIPLSSVAEQHEPPMAQANHFKCYQVLDWGDYQPRRAQLKDQFGQSVARVLEPFQLCNPVDKNGEGIPDKDYHLVCYRIQDDPTGPYQRVKEVQVKDQFYKGPLWVGMSDMVCVPAMKQYDPR